MQATSVLHKYKASAYFYSGFLRLIKRKICRIFTYPPTVRAITNRLWQRPLHPIDYQQSLFKNKAVLSIKMCLTERFNLHGNLTPPRFSPSRPHCVNCDWTEVSLSLCAGHCALAATQVSGAALYRSVCNRLLM